jgi:glyceraldehyde 3-phosphate dehydrogenase
MAIKVAINGFGRIGRLAYRLMHDDPQLDIVALNDLSNAEELAYLLKYDTAQGRFDRDIKVDGDKLIVDGKTSQIFAEKDPSTLPWEKLGVDVVLECTGIFLTEEKAGLHLQAGAKKVLISAPGKGKIKMVVYGVNENILTKDDHIVSAASCTTNCLAPMVKVLDDAFGVEKGFMTTVHAYTNDQSLMDQPHRKGYKSRRGRAAALSIIPSTTGAASAVGKVLTHLNGKLDGTALRVPTITGSIVDLTVELKKPVTVESVNAAFKKASNPTLTYTEDPIVSVDVIGSHSSLFDANTTQVLDVDGRQLVKVMAWYDNEMTYTAQMVKTLKLLVNLK